MTVCRGYTFIGSVCLDISSIPPLDGDAAIPPLLFQKLLAQELIRKMTRKTVRVILELNL